MRAILGNNKVLDAQAATGVGAPKFLADYQHVVFAVAASGTANMTIKMKVSNQDTLPDFNAAQSATNLWSYAQMKNLSDGSTVDGATGLVLTADKFENYEVNTNLVKWVCPHVTAFTAGAVTAFIDGANDTSDTA